MENEIAELRILKVSNGYIVYTGKNIFDRSAAIGPAETLVFETTKSLNEFINEKFKL